MILHLWVLGNSYHTLNSGSLYYRNVQHVLLIIDQMTSGACSRYLKIFFKEKENMLVLRYVIFKMATIISELKS